MSSPPKKDLLKPLGSRPKTPGRSEPRERNDRFITNRGATDIENAKLLEQVDTGGSEFKTELAKQLSIGNSNKLLAFQSSRPKTPQKPEELLPISSSGPQSGRKPTRHIPALPDRILDAPELKDDFNVNVLHWSTGNQLAVGLGPSLYLWNGETGDVSEFQNFDPTDITAVRWDGSGAHVALGMADNSVLMFHVARQKQVRILRGHTGRITSLTWNGPVLTSGGGSNFIMNSDVRVKEHCKDKMQLHDKEVCGLAWNSEGDQLASGGEDNIVGLWDSRKLEQAQHVLAEHRAAVKALAWCPWQRRMLATGGGDGDRQVRLWDTKTGTQMSSFDATAAVGSLVWNPHEKELVGGLGYPNFQITLWRYPTCQPIGEFFGHDQRILHMAISPDQCTVCSGGGDETLRFWKMFQKPAAKKAPMGTANSGGHSVLKSVSIR